MKEWNRFCLMNYKRAATALVKTADLVAIAIGNPLPWPLLQSVSDTWQPVPRHTLSLAELIIRCQAECSLQRLCISLKEKRNGTDFEYRRTGLQFRPGETRGSRAAAFFVRSHGRTVAATKGTGPSPLGFPDFRSISARMRRSLRVCIFLAASMRPRTAALSREAGGGWSSVGDIVTYVDC